MARGLLTGLIWGGVISVGGAAVVSLSTPLPQPPDVTASAPEAVAPTAPVQAVPEVSAPAPETIIATESEDAPVQPAAPTVPDSDDLVALETDDSAAASPPTIGTVAPLPEATGTGSTPPDITVTEDVVDRATEPAVPEPANIAVAPTISTEPATPTAVVDPEPEPEPTLTEADPVPSQTPDTVDEAKVAAVPETSETETPTDQTQSDEVSATEENQQPPSGLETGVAEAVDEPDPAPIVDAAPEPAEDGPTEPESRIAALPRVEAPDAETADPPVSDDSAENDQAETATPVAPTPSIGQRVVPLTDRDQAASSLPSVAATQPDVENATGNAAELTLPNRPIELFAAPFVNPEDKPLMGIVLIDDVGSIGAEALASFPYPLSFAIDPLDPLAAQKMARYRNAGFEVLALIDMPQTAAPQDTETVLEVAFTRLPESVGVLEGTEAGFQTNRPVADQITAILRDQGFGLVTQNTGLNTVQKLAVREGVPSAFVFRDFDGAGQTPTVMRRFLDQAAFRAGQEGGVVMMGRVQPDTISALLLWGLQDRANRVALAPVSAVLLQNVD